MPRKEDPVKAAFEGREDLYDVATWEVRSLLDRLAVRTYLGLKRAGRWTLIAFALLLFAGEFVLTVMLVTDRPVLGVLAALSILPAAALAAYFWLGDPTMREPLPTLAFTFVLGVALAGIAAVVNTIAFNSVFAVAGSELVFTVAAVGLFFVVVAPIEEAVKWLAVRLFAYRRPEFDAVVDGVVYGAVAGLGFATIENTLYIVQGFLSPASVGFAGGLGGAVQVATSRAFVGPGHVIYSAWAGYYLGLAKFNPGRRGPIAVKGLLVAVFIHATYNSAVTVLAMDSVGFLAFVLLFDGFWFAALYLKLARYRRLYRRISETVDPSLAAFR